MGDGDGVHVAHLGLRQPRGEVRRHAGAHQTALVAADGVERQRRAFGGHRHDVAVRHQAKLDERLEAVADAEHQAVAVVQQVAHGLGHGRGAEERGDELGGAVRFVAAGEAARDHDDLALLDLLYQRVGRFGHGRRGEVVHDERAHVGARTLEGCGGIVFAVVAREHGDDHMRLGHAGAGVHGLLRSVEGHGLDGLALLIALGTVREHGFDAALPCILQLGQVERFAGGHELVGLGGLADLADLHQVGRGRNLRSVGKFDDEGAVGRGEQVVHGNAVGQLHTDLVADRHLEDRFGGGTIARSGHGQSVAEIGKLLNRGECFQQRVLVWSQAIGLIARGDADHTVAGALELGGGGALHIAHRHGEGDQGRWNVKLLERAGHGVLAADRASAQIHLGHQSAQHGGHRLAPPFRLVTQLLEILLEA